MLEQAQVKAILLVELSKCSIGEGCERRLDLDLCNNQKFYDSATYCVFQSFQHNTTLVHLNLSNTRLVATEDTAQAFNKMLRVNKTLTHLDLLVNKFSPCCVFQGLQHNASLVYLNLSYAGLYVTEDTAQALTTMLQVNKTLTHLNLSNNPKFSDSGAYCVFQGLQHNTTLVHLNLSTTRLVAAEDTAQALNKMLRVNKTLTHLDLSQVIRNCLTQDLIVSFKVFSTIPH